MRTIREESRREVNQNFIAWSPVEVGEDELFTPTTVVNEWRYELDDSVDFPARDETYSHAGIVSKDLDEDADDIAASDAAKAEGVAGSFDDLVKELGL